MKKILLTLAATVALLCTTASCENEPKNPGDFTVKPYIELSDIRSITTGETFPIIVARDFDTIFQYQVILKDTVRDSNGAIVEIKNDTTYLPASFTTRFVEAEPIYLPYKPDTFRIDIVTNARWNAPAPTSPMNWYNAVGATTGGGDGYMTFRSNTNYYPTRTTPANLRFYSNDSTFMYQVPLYQYGYGITK